MNGKLWFQPSVTPIMDGIVDLHNHIFGFLVFVLGVVVWIFGTTLYYFWWNLSDASTRIYVLESRRILHDTVLETVWTLLPSFILIAIGIPSFALLYAMDEVVHPKLTVKVIGHQWYWSFEYSPESVFLEKAKAEKGKVMEEGLLESLVGLPTNKELVELWNDFHKEFRFDLEKEEFEPIQLDSYMKNEDELEEGEVRLLATTEPLVLPVRAPIRFLVTGADVIHSFAVPSLGVKVDAIPGRQNQTVVYIKHPGVYRGQCSEICGVNHGFMPVEIKAVEAPEFLSWYLVKQKPL
jgi:cytochrome c oxidase subunit 2